MDSATTRKILFDRRSTHHGPAKQNLLQSASDRCRAVIGSDSGRSPRGIRRQDQLGHCRHHPFRPGSDEPHGQVTTSYGTFGSANAGFNLAYGKDKWGNFISANGLNSTRFLDPPELNVMHDRVMNNLFDRFDFKPSEKNTVNLNFQFTRSWYQTPNSYDAQNATAWTGLVVDNGGYGPNGALVGPPISMLRSRPSTSRPPGRA